MDIDAPAPLETNKIEDTRDIEQTEPSASAPLPTPVAPPTPMPAPLPAAAHTEFQAKGVEAEAAIATPQSPKQPPPGDLLSAENSTAIGWTNSMPSPTATDEANTLFTGQQTNNDLLQALAALLTKGGIAKSPAQLEQHRRRSVVLCLANLEDTKQVEAALGNTAYEVTIASSPEQVTAMLQTSHLLDILLLDPNFYAGQQGGATIMRYLNMLNPARRRRVFVVVTSHAYRTLDAQAAFAHGVNMILNSNELESLPEALSKSIDDFNNLYRAFNQVSGINAF